MTESQEERLPQTEEPADGEVGEVRHPLPLFRSR